MNTLNCMGYLHWTAHNCDTCVRAFRPKKGKELPDYNATQRLVNLGRECRIKFAIEYAMGTWTDMPDEIGALISGKVGQWSDQCMMHSSDPNDGPNNGPRKPRIPDGDPMQFMLFSIADEIENTERITAPQYEHA